MKENIIILLFIGTTKLLFSQNEVKFTYQEIIKSVENFDKFNKLILEEKDFYQQNYSNNEFFVDGKNSVKIDRKNKRIEFFFTKESNYSEIVNAVKKNLKEKEFKYKETPDGKYYVSTYTSEKFFIEIYKGYKGNRHLIIHKL